jgi:hypothetical protein
MNSKNAMMDIPQHSSLMVLALFGQLCIEALNSNIQ